MILEILLIALGFVNLIISIIILINFKNSNNNYTTKSDNNGVCICSKCQKTYPSSQKKCPWCGKKNK